MSQFQSFSISTSNPVDSRARTCEAVSRNACTFRVLSVRQNWTLDSLAVTMLLAAHQAGSAMWHPQRTVECLAFVRA